jgi:FlaA1/EpsC-like NDP-sugar epimerase
VPEQTEPVLVVGAGVAGGIVAEVLCGRSDRCLQPVGFVDDDPSRQGTVIHGLPVLGTRYDIPALVEQYGIKEIIIAIPSAPGALVRQLVEICHRTGARLKILPGIYDLITGKIKVSAIREVQVEDLLGREPVSLNVEQIAGYLAGRQVLITGGGGSIGSELCRQIAGFKPGLVILIGHGENSIYDVEVSLREEFPRLPLVTGIADVKDRCLMRRLFLKYRPDVVFHTAAHKHVPLMERCPEEAVKNNIFGTRSVAEAACHAGTGTFILVSTDKAVNPVGVMGATKRVAEMVVLEMNRRGKTRFAAVRFGNVLGSRGSVVPFFKRQIAGGGPVTVTHRHMVRYFMTVTEAAQLVIQAGSMAGGGEIFILDMGCPVKIVDLARNLIRLSGFEPGSDIPIEFTGIRPGEKLAERLVAEGEGMAPTEHGRIFKVASPERDFVLLEIMLEAMESADFSFAEKEIKAWLQKVLPDYRPGEFFKDAVEDGVCL